MRISQIEVGIINVPYVAPIRWAGGANANWTRLVVEVRTDDGLVGLGEANGGEATKAIIENEVAPMFLGESPFNIERMLAKATFVPFYFGKAGKSAIAALEVACWDLMGKAVDRPLCDLLGGRLRDEVPFAAYLFHRNANEDGQGEVDTTEQVVARARELVDQYGFSTIKYKGGVKGEKEEIANMWALREEFPDLKLRFDPNAIYSASTAIRMGKEFEAVGLEYYEDPVWGNVAMARVRSAVDIPFATNMCITDLDSLADGYSLGSVDIVLGDIFEWGGITNIKKLQGFCETTQIGMNFHSAAEGGIGQAAYLHLAAACQALPFAVDTTIVELAADVIVDGTITLSNRGTIGVPDGPGLGVELDPERYAAAREAYNSQGEAGPYAEDEARPDVIPVKSML